VKRLVPLGRQLFVAFAGLAALAIVLVAWDASLSIRALSEHETGRELDQRGRLLRNQLEAFAAGSPGRLLAPGAADSLLRRLGAGVAMRITFVRADGLVLGDTHEDPAKMDDHAGRPEIRAAPASGDAGRSLRRSATLGRDLLYVALPWPASGPPLAVLRTSLPVSDVAAQALRLQRRVLAAGGLALLVSLALAGWLARRISRPLERIRAGADRYAAGELELRLAAGARTLEVAGLADSLNRMAASLQARLHDLAGQRNEREALLEGLNEGVLALDGACRVQSANARAVELLDLGPQPRGAALFDLLRHEGLEAFLRDRFADGRPAESEIVVCEQPPRRLGVWATALPGRPEDDPLLLVVLSDVTRLHQLEQLRREFVGNVSHELRTPVTSIRGYVEALRDGALAEPETAARFLEIIERQAARLTALVDDLLALSRIERLEDQGPPATAPVRVDELLAHLVEDAAPLAREAGIALERRAPAELVWTLARPLVERALSNLLVNALRYSEGGSAVVLGAEVVERAGGARLRLAVADQGCGIAAEHLPRIFERFYVVDRARSRRLGGTGLGLAIVKHVAALHGGEVGVESEPGRGSVFWLELPPG